MSFTDRLLHPINDVTTDITAPVQYIKPIGSRSLEQLNTFKSKEWQPKLHPDIKPLTIPAGADLLSVFTAIQQHVGKKGWDTVLTDNGAMKVQAVAVTPLMRFKDDIVIEIRQGSSNTVQMRSRSRLGKGDIGANAKRIKDFLSTLSMPAGLR